MLTKTQLRVLEVFASNITEKFSIKKISEVLKKPYPLIHRSVKSLLSLRFLDKDKQSFLSLNYRENHSVLAYVESLKAKDFLAMNKTIALCANDVLVRLKLDFFVFLIFGSSICKAQPRDVDVLFVVENPQRVNEVEKILHNIASSFATSFDIKVITSESAHEMFSKRDEQNVANETLNQHIILFGAENYYRILKNARR
ncbi:hypothetical protein HY489_05145 [Candidatus Woesearchaeota archaeon]|nr:hypothetical protein [Candidatus Woesearchaeota archaeon]